MLEPFLQRNHQLWYLRARFALCWRSGFLLFVQHVLNVVQRAAGKPLGEVSLGELPAGLEFLGEETLEPQRKVLRFAWTGDAPAESLHQDLLILTDEEEQPEIRVPLSVLKRRQDP